MEREAVREPRIARQPAGVVLIAGATAHPPQETRRVVEAGGELVGALGEGALRQGLDRHDPPADLTVDRLAPQPPPGRRDPGRVVARTRIFAGRLLAAPADAVHVGVARGVAAGPATEFLLAPGTGVYGRGRVAGLADQGVHRGGSTAGRARRAGANRPAIREGVPRGDGRRFRRRGAGGFTGGVDVARGRDGASAHAAEVGHAFGFALAAPYGVGAGVVDAFPTGAFSEGRDGDAAAATTFAAIVIIVLG